MQKEKISITKLLSKGKIVAIFVLMCLILTILKPSFIQPSNIINVFRQISIISILSMGALLVIITGGIDLSPGSIVAVSGVVAAMFASNPDIPVVIYI